MASEPKKKKKRKANNQSLTARHRLVAKQKQKKALELRLSGLTFEEVAAEVGYASKASAHVAITKAIKESIREPAKEVAAMELARLDKMWAALWSVVQDPESNKNVGPAPDPADFDKPGLFKMSRANWEEKRLKAFSMLLSIQKRRAALLGLDAAKTVKSEVTGKDGGPIESSFQFRPEDMTNDELRRAAEGR